MKNPVLLLGSLIFYAWGEPIYLFLMIFSIIFNYICGLDISRNLGDKKAARKSLVFNVAVNLAVLGFFKYEGFVLNSLNMALPVDIPFREVALPVGFLFILSRSFPTSSMCTGEMSRCRRTCWILPCM